MEKQSIFKPLTAEEWEIMRLSDLLIKAEHSLKRTERYYRKLLLKVIMMLGALIILGVLMLFI